MIANALRLLRVYHRISQYRLADEMQISKSYLSEIESGKKKVTLPLLEQYSRHFSISLSSLLFFAEELHKRPNDIGRGDAAITALRLLNKIAEGADHEEEC